MVKYTEVADAVMACRASHEDVTARGAKERGAPNIVEYVIGPDGRRLTRADLPQPQTRWVIRRKAEVVAAVRGGLLSWQEACTRYQLNPEELCAWQDGVDRYGPRGLRTTKIQFYPRSVTR